MRTATPTRESRDIAGSLVRWMPRRVAVLAICTVVCMPATHAVRAATAVAGDIAPRAAPDGVLDAADLVVLQRVILGQIVPTRRERVVADVAPIGSPDGRIDVADLVVLARAVQGLVRLPPVVTGSPPSVVINAPRNALVNSVVSLDASLSSDPDGAIVSYLWRQTDGPPLAMAGNDVPVARFKTPRTDADQALRFTLTVFDNDGESTTASVTVTALAPLPPPDSRAVSAASGVDGSVIVNGLPGSVTGGTDVHLQDLTTGRETLVRAGVDGSFASSLSPPAARLLAVWATDPRRNASPPVVVGVGTVLDIVLTSPADGSRAAGNTVNVTGVVNGLPNAGVSVNDVPACEYKGRFYVNRVPLDPGTNLLTAIAHTADGISASAALLVTGGTPSALTVSADPPCGHAPHATRFSVQDGAGSGVSSLEIDFDGDGRVDYVGDGKAPAPHTYTSPGVYQARVTARDRAGAAVVSSHWIVVWDAADTDALLRSIYTGMLGRLRVGAVDGALNFLSTGVQDKYQEIFDTLRDDLPTIVDQLGTLKRGPIGSEMAEYLVTRDLGGQQTAFPVYFLRGTDGVWRIDGM